MMSGVGQMQGSYGLVANLHRGIRLLATLETFQEVPQMRGRIRGPTGNVLTDRSRSLPAVVALLAPGFGENTIAVLAEFQCSLLPLKYDAPTFHKRVHISQRPGAGELRVFENGAERVRCFGGLE